jgi:hypothetical protein
MPLICIAEVKPGMVLQAPVYNLERQLLLGAGAVISERHVRVFQTWGVREVDVRRAESVEPVKSAPRAACDEASVVQEVARVLVNQMADSPIMVEIRRLLVARKMRARTLRGAA